ncbi:MAG: hypothetical protein CM1200mP41_21880 [Gammaproteobacteria bacterium]|nr:MAG: hypothetical protein CM1200mP41_21880 [Gammaproteobacteria bacterium]
MALLTVTGATVRFGGLVAVNNVSFEAEPGKVRALIGPNGAGKTTLFKAIAGEETLESGTIKFQDQEIQPDPHEISKRGVRRTFQTGGLFGELTALENVLAGLHTQVPSSFWRSFV